ncbi:DNA polymerase III subunit alpha [Azospira inquinata]|uniref:DNA polymerase III subunit alpha n=1 Tax=Azospira inquinata TaxID=2785627 RepID=A0A975SPB4_9RHOO|nr:DNA polymerase III subunit alpha [Azospira inquinata]QWT47419.1 DNA polymerase III subunit alpha [Azospira inquinata]QWT49958.1 DNA polymerase III subunit alpha [Azospira inquinata]
MTDPRFIHLRLHSEFSITEGIVRLDAAIERAETDGMPAFALTDLAAGFGLVKFYRAARPHGIKPIFGSDLWLANEADPTNPYRLLLLVGDQDGYLRLCELLSKAYLVPDRPERAEIRRAWLDELGCGGLIALSGADHGDIGEALRNGKPALAAERAREWARRFPDSFYLEVQRYGQPQQEAMVRDTVALAAELDLPLVATHPIQFMDREDFKAHEARVCIAQGYVLGDRRRPRNFTEEQYFKTQGEMAELFADLPEALENTVEIAKRCNVNLVLGKNFLPQFPTPDGVSLDDYLAKTARDGLEVRLAQLYPDPEERLARRPEYDARLEREINTVIQMGFPGYFLIVADFINWGKNNGVPVGPGRGSGAGSLVAYSIGITDLDPLRYALLFERFLNPERVSMPDFDVDFCQDNRGRVIDYVRHRYGLDAVSQIATFGTMSSKAVIRDVGRVLDLPYSLCDSLSKLIPVEQNKPLSLTKAIEAEPQLKEKIDSEEEIKELFELAMKLEDTTRNIGMHAGGVVIAPGKLTEYSPLYCQLGSDSVVTQYDKDDVEKVGLVKFDFLGLRNLTIIKLAVDYVERLTGSCPDLLALGYEDQAAYQILKDANTTAIFQVESEGMKKLLKKLQPDRFEDIIAVLALYRPGPLGSGMVDDFILRKKGQQKIDYFHEDLKAALEPTYGVIVYQEQVMQIAQIIGGYTLGGADLLRRAMGKKKVEEMAKHRDIMREGARKKGYDENLAMQLFDLMEKFAEYGFNKSHTAAYAVVTYQTAWLKAHHCAAFMAATMSVDMDNTDSVKIFVEDTLKNGVTILGPDVNASDYRFVPVDPKTIRYGLGGVKGTGQQAVECILAAREADGPFKDLFDFCRRVDKRMVNRRTVEALIRAGSFDSLDPDRHKMLASVGIALEAAEQVQRDALQAGLFDAGPASVETAVDFVSVPPWDERERLMQEKQALGFFFSGHPFDAVKGEVSRFVRRNLSQLEPQKDFQLLAGLVTGVRTKITQRGKMAFIQLDDGSDMKEVSVFSETFDANRQRLKEDEVLVVEGKVQKDDFSGGLRIVAENIYTLAEARGRFARQLRLAMNGNGDARKLQNLIAPYVSPEGCPIRIAYTNPVASCELLLGEKARVRPDEELLKSLRDWLTPEAVDLQYQ